MVPSPSPLTRGTNQGLKCSPDPELSRSFFLNSQNSKHGEVLETQVHMNPSQGVPSFPKPLLLWRICLRSGPRHFPSPAPHLSTPGGKPWVNVCTSKTLLNPGFSQMWMSVVRALPVAPMDTAPTLKAPSAAPVPLATGLQRGGLGPVQVSQVGRGSRS